MCWCEEFCVCLLNHSLGLTTQTPCRASHLSCRSPAAPQCGGASACGRYWPPSSDLKTQRTDRERVWRWAEVVQCCIQSVTLGQYFLQLKTTVHLGQGCSFYFTKGHTGFNLRGEIRPPASRARHTVFSLLIPCDSFENYTTSRAIPSNQSAAYPQVKSKHFVNQVSYCPFTGLKVTTQ